MQKKFICFFGVIFLTGCGQIGPLYLPGQKPPVYVPKPKQEAKPEIKATADTNSNSTSNTDNS